MKIDFDELKASLKFQARTLLSQWVPGGTLSGNEYCAGSIHGGAGNSFRYNVEKCCGSDFNGQQAVGDLIDLFAKVNNLSPGEAARQLLETHGLGPQRQAPAPKLAAPKYNPERPPQGEYPECSHKRLGLATKKYEYTDLDGNLLYVIARYDLDGSKEFFPWTYADGRWQMKAWPKPRALYNLYELSQRPDAAVLIVEGEKSQQAAKELLSDYYVVISWSGGTSAWSSTDWSPLHGRKILIWPDRDRQLATDKNAQKYNVSPGDEIPYRHQPGTVAAFAIAEHLLPYVKELKVLDVKDEPAKWDAADAFEAGWTQYDVIAWAKPRARLIVAPEIVTKEPEMVPPDSQDIPWPGEHEYNLTVVGDDAVEALTQEPVSPSIYNLWNECGVESTKMGPRINLLNAFKILDGQPELRDLIWYDDFHQDVFTKGKTGPRSWTDNDDSLLTMRFQGEWGFRKITKALVFDVVRTFAYSNVKNEPRDWINSLVWDGEPRIDDFFQACLGAVDNEYTKAASKNFWIGLAARIYEPGCKLDNVVVLEGIQGARKSTAVAAIGGKWFAESSVDVTNSIEFTRSIQGKLLMEIGELKSFKGADMDAVKRMISTQNDELRVMHVGFKKVPRVTVFVGTTNADEWHEDETGARRFWPIKVGTIDIDSIKASRAQLFAEAAVRFKAGESYWTMPDDATKAEQSQRRVSDVWEDEIEAIVRGKETVSIPVILGVMGVTVDKMTQGHKNRVGKVLRGLSFERVSVRIDGQTSKVWQKTRHK